MPWSTSSTLSGDRGAVARRLLDVVAAGGGLLVLAPLLVVVGLLVRLTSPGPAFHRAQRVGRDGRLFTLYKFRSMREGAASAGPGITRAGDERITGVGAWLRRTKLDELPQLINVWKGDMSLVGPRPEDPRYVEGYTPEQRRVLAVRPGITSAASVLYRHEEQMLEGEEWEKTYREKVLPDKLRIELEYLEHRTLASDLGILLKTFVAVLR
ncbi:MAG TPA: sugar transferase [Kiritimatiellia bacterium]|nr:sugar transferase [Kiritimatiellia bacterium]